jgi:hypothetical protein
VVLGGVGIWGRGGAANKEQARVARTNIEMMGINLLVRFIMRLGMEIERNLTLSSTGLLPEF